MKPPFRIAVIECDDTTPQNRHAGYKDWFRILLEKATTGLDNVSVNDLEVTGFNVVKEPDLYPVDNDIDAVLLSGSSKLLQASMLVATN